MRGEATDAPSDWILPFARGRAPAGVGVSLAGGKGVNLLRLAAAGFPVPDGFLVTTGAYRAFVGSKGLEARIAASLAETDAEQPAALEAASAAIRRAFTAADLPSRLGREILAARHLLGEAPVAVRSSATAEDAPGMSFAGQQDTYLNVAGDHLLLAAVLDCWASLWTARAIAYRARNRVSQEGLALAVVVQRMVDSRASGVLFTANPVTGLRRETVIEAVVGLGEALVSGAVEPDRYVVDARTLTVASKSIGAKTLSIHPRQGGGTRTVAEHRGDRQALPEERILELAWLGERVSREYGAPQDVEWAWTGDGLQLLQSRPITSLYPLPAGPAGGPLRVMFSFGAVQGLLDPMTPLGRQVVKLLFATGAGLFGIRATLDTQRALRTAGERLWVDVTALLGNTVGRRVFAGALGFVEPAVRQALEGVLDEPELAPPRPGIRLPAALRLARFFLPLAWNVLLNLAAPAARRDRIVSHGERVLREMRARSAAVTGDPWERLAAQARLLPEVAGRELRRTIVLFVSGVASGMLGFARLSALARRLPSAAGDRPSAGEDPSSGAWRSVILEMTRGLPHNPTTEMDLALWETARRLRRHPRSRAELLAGPAAELARRFREGRLAEATQCEVAEFLAAYGARGVGEIDIGRPRWRDDPTSLFQVLAGYLRIEDPALAPDAVFARGAEAAERAREELCTQLRTLRGGRLLAAQARFFSARIRELLGMRESPKFFAVRMFDILRRALLEIGGELVRAEVLEEPQDLFFLTFAELASLAAREGRGWRGLIRGRRREVEREKLRRQVPRVLLSDGRAFYEGLAPAGGSGAVLAGSPVSPGTVTGTVRVVYDPREARLEPGEILVCPGTDPAWTPLFLTAGGLVMEVGGMMTHGAVVAREYGIPAVVGVHRATERLPSGTRIRLDGGSGRITLLEEAGEDPP